MFTYSLSLAYYQSCILCPTKWELPELFKETFLFKFKLTSAQQFGVVIDSGPLIYKLVDSKKESFFTEIADKSVYYVISKYPQSCAIAFGIYTFETTS